MMGAVKMRVALTGDLNPRVRLVEDALRTSHSAVCNPPRRWPRHNAAHG